MGSKPSRQAFAKDASSYHQHPKNAVLTMKSAFNDNEAPSTSTLGSAEDAAHTADACIDESPAANKEMSEVVKIIETSSLLSGDDKQEQPVNNSKENNNNNNKNDEEDCDDKKQQEQVSNKENNNKNEGVDDDDLDDNSSSKMVYPSPRSYYAATLASGDRAGSVVNRNKAFLSLLQSTEPSWRA
jgi:hypothetical protein